jgi:hypothetical protein
VALPLVGSMITVSLLSSLISDDTRLLQHEERRPVRRSSLVEVQPRLP